MARYLCSTAERNVFTRILLFGPFCCQNGSRRRSPRGCAKLSSLHGGREPQNLLDTFGVRERLPAKCSDALHADTHQVLQTMKTLLKCTVAAILCLLLASCWAPETFDATLHVDKDKNFKFTFNGTMAYLGALAEIVEKGRLSTETEEAIKKAEEELRKQPGFKKVESDGKGRFKVQFEEKGPVGNGKKVFLDLVEFKVAPTGRITILGSEISAESRSQMLKLKLLLNGTLSVTTDLTVVKENAASKPSLGGRAYKWNVKLEQTERPEIVLQP